jgi:hypothetical protein
VRAYTEASEETLRARKLLKEWAEDGDITQEQYERLAPETVSDLRTMNIFLRLVLFVFTLVGIGAAVALFFTMFLSQAAEQTDAIFALIFAVVFYVAAEILVAQARLYRYGIEEALVVCSVLFLCGGIVALSPHHQSEIPPLMLGAGATFSLWIWHRFGLWYAFPAAMMFALFLPGCWTASASAQHGFACALYAAGLICIIAIRSHCHFDALEHEYSLAEAFLWLGVYLVLNLKASDLIHAARWWAAVDATEEVSRPFYWTTWVLIWCLPPLVLTRGVRRKDRFVIAAGLIVTMITFVTNKPYLGLEQHTWDPMILGVALTGVAVFLQRWLAQGPGGVRHGFTAARLSAKEQHAMNAGSSLLGLLRPYSITPDTQAGTPATQASGDHARFGGGSGGGGASGDF